MSETDKQLEKYRTTAGVDSKFADVANDDHALKERFGNDEDAKRIEFEAEIIGERVAQWYDDPAAAIREYLSNAETACIRRAKSELLETGLTAPSGVTDMLEKAREETGYEPIIEVTYNQNPEETRFIIEDNGIGISTDEYLVLKKIGYSTSHMDGERLGQFGMGYMSGFQLSGTDGVFNMRTRSFLTEETYSTANYITNFEYLDGLRDNYGTRFEFPAFSEKAQGIDVRSKVAEFAEGMRVTVLYREKDSNGQEVFNEDYTPAALEADYPEDSLVITYENEFFEAVMSPSSPEGRSYVTYNISMPIRRNDSPSHRTSSSVNRFNTDWRWDFRGKSENGPIVASDDDSVVGLAPVSNSKYENLPDERKDSFIPRSEVPDDAIVMPVPASSRDSYEGGHRDFWEYVSDCLQEEWKNEAGKRIGSLDDFDDFKHLPSREKAIIFRGYQKFGPGYGVNDPDNIVEHFEEELDASLDTDVAEKLDGLSDKELMVRRGCANPQYKGSANKTQAWKIIDKASPDGTVYIGKTISPKKAEIAWALDDNNVVVRVEPYNDESTKECYERLQETWGWELLKELPSRNLKENLPSLPDDVAEKYETMSDKDTKSTSSNNSNRRTSRNPKTKRIKVYGSTRRSRRGMSDYRAEQLFDKLDAGDTVAGGRHNTINSLIVRYEGDVSSLRRFKKHTNHEGVGVAAVPKYVQNYLKDADNVYTSLDAVEREQKKNATIDFNGTDERLDQLTESDLLLIRKSGFEEHFGDRLDEAMAYVEEEKDMSFDRCTLVNKSDINQYWAVDTDATVYHPNVEQMRKDLDIPDIDWSHPVMKAMNTGRYGRFKDKTDNVQIVAEYLQEHDCLPTKDDS